MSKYKEISVQFKSMDSLFKALKDLGCKAEFSRSKTENGLSLYGYMGDERSERVVIAIRQNEVNKLWSGGYSNDIGISYDPKSKSYNLIVSEYDQGKEKVMKAMNKLRQQYTFHEVSAKAKKKGYRVLSQADSAGNLKLRLVRS